MLKRLFGGRPKVDMTLARPEAGRGSARWARSSAPRRRRVRVAGLRPETADAVTVSIEPLDGAPLAFRAGQYLTHCLVVDGESLRRAYSLSVPPESGELAFTCKRVADGRVSRHITERLAVGDEYEILGPGGDFVLDAEDHGALVFVAAGSGITPVIALIEAALIADPARNCRLVYGSRDAASILFRERLEALSARHAGLSVCHVLSQPDDDWRGERGRLDGARALALAGGPASDACWYLCGPAPLMDEVAACLASAGVGPSSVRRESFASATHAAAAHPREPQPIAFAHSEVEVVQQPGQSILDAGLAAGLPLEFSCTVGGCGACKLRVLDGPVIQDEPNCLTAEERAAGYVLACSAFASAPVRIEA